LEKFCGFAKQRMIDYLIHGFVFVIACDLKKMVAVDVVG
jgi:hypothetical protein